jgi:hypothetical protein
VGAVVGLLAHLIDDPLAVRHLGVGVEVAVAQVVLRRGK